MKILTEDLELKSYNDIQQQRQIEVKAISSREERRNDGQCFLWDGILLPIFTLTKNSKLVCEFGTHKLEFELLIRFSAPSPNNGFSKSGQLLNSNFLIARLFSEVIFTSSPFSLNCSGYYTSCLFWDNSISPKCYLLFQKSKSYTSGN